MVPLVEIILANPLLIFILLYSQGAQAYCPYQHCPYPNTYNWRTCKCEPRPKCRPFACPFPKEFNSARCRCVCPFELSRFCSRGERFDANTCQCVSICPFRNARCNQFQEFNRDTCQCECVEVVPARRRFRDCTDDDNGWKPLGSVLPVSILIDEHVGAS